jgi:hypothetical protein
MGDLIGWSASESRPPRHHHVGGSVGRVERSRSARFDERDPRTQVRQLPSSDPTGAVDEHDVPSSHRSEYLKRPRDLALDIQGPGELLGEPRGQVDGEI